MMRSGRVRREGGERCGVFGRAGVRVEGALRSGGGGGGGESGVGLGGCCGRPGRRLRVALFWCGSRMPPGARDGVAVVGQAAGIVMVGCHNG